MIIQSEEKKINKNLLKISNKDENDILNILDIYAFVKDKK
jgi:hypothetical protein